MQPLFTIKRPPLHSFDFKCESIFILAELSKTIFFNLGKYHLDQESPYICGYTTLPIIFQKPTTIRFVPTGEKGDRLFLIEGDVNLQDERWQGGLA